MRQNIVFSTTKNTKKFSDPDPSRSKKGNTPSHAPPPRRLRHLNTSHSKILATPMQLLYVSQVLKNNFLVIVVALDNAKTGYNQSHCTVCNAQELLNNEKLSSKCIFFKWLQLYNIDWSVSCLSFHHSRLSQHVSLSSSVSVSSSSSPVSLVQHSADSCNRRHQAKQIHWRTFIFYTTV